MRRPACLCYALGKMDEKNKLYFGDNLKILREYVPGASVDLIYLDPPFNSQATYNVLFKEKSGEESAAQIMAFEDTWGWGLEPEGVYKGIVTSGPRKLADLLQASPAQAKSANTLSTKGDFDVCQRAWGLFRSEGTRFSPEDGPSVP
jgi:hypothetical protein